MDFGEKLFQLRMERGVYQRQLAEYLGVSVGTISNYENSVHYPDLSTLCRFAEFFEVSTDYLLDLTSNAMPIDGLNVSLADGHTVGSVLNSVVALSQPSRQNLGKYVSMLKICEDAPRKDQILHNQGKTIRRQRQMIERMNQTIEDQAAMVQELNEQLISKND